MRQAGIIAAPGIIALKKMVSRLKEDHENARYLAENLIKHEEFKIDLDSVQTNIIFGKFIHENMSAFDLANKLSNEGIKIGAYSNTEIRFVTHYGITREDIKKVIETINALLS